MADITIRTIDDLETLVNGGYGNGTQGEPLNVVLANDLDFSELEDSDPRKWNFGAGTISGTLWMNFDGQEYEIKNLNFNNTDKTFSLFTTGEIKGSIKNLTIRDTEIFANTVYFFCNNMTDGEFENVHIKGYFSCGAFNGMCRGGNPNFDRCSIAGTIRFTNNFMGFGYYVNLVKRCYIAADIHQTGTNQDFYLFGYTQKINNCHFIGKVEPAAAFGRVKAGRNNDATRCSYVILTNAAEAAGSGAKTTVWGTNCLSCFYNNDEYDYGNDTENGADKTDLQSASWLRERGYPI